MKFSRRDLIIGGLGMLAVGGCESTQTTPSGFAGHGLERPGPLWPSVAQRPVVTGQAEVVPIVPAPPRYVPPTPQPDVPIKRPTPPVAMSLGQLQIIPRSSWAKASPIGSRIRKMGSVSRITVHHEGWTPVWFTDTTTTAARLDAIRRGHLSRLRAGDIGYHYIIDRAGRIWQGRDDSYQGAHVRSNNENNIGIMVLGNFETQTPSSAQLASLRNTLLALKKEHKVSTRRIYTHKEITSTSCPGRNLQGQMVNLRRSGLA